MLTSNVHHRPTAAYQVDMYRVTTGQGKVREIQGQGKVREF